METAVGIQRVGFIDSTLKVGEKSTLIQHYAIDFRSSVHNRVTAIRDRCWSNMVGCGQPKELFLLVVEIAYPVSSRYPEAYRLRRCRDKHPLRPGPGNPRWPGAHVVRPAAPGSSRCFRDSGAQPDSKLVGWTRCLPSLSLHCILAVGQILYCEIPHGLVHMIDRLRSVRFRPVVTGRNRL